MWRRKGAVTGSIDPEVTKRTLPALDQSRPYRISLANKETDSVFYDMKVHRFISSSLPTYQS